MGLYIILQGMYEALKDGISAEFKDISASSTAKVGAKSTEDIDIKKIAKDLYENNEDYSESFVNVISVDVKAYAKEHFEKSVKKTLTIPSWLNDLALERNINFSQVLQEALLAKVRM